MRRVYMINHLDIHVESVHEVSSLINCECKIWSPYNTQEIAYCPTHAKAFEMREALKQTLAALISYKKYTPEPYKQNPIYIIGSHEAEVAALKALEGL